MKSLEYSYETSSGGGGGTREFDEPSKEVTFTIMRGTGNGAKVNEDEVVQVNVRWDNFEESFELHYKKSNLVLPGLYWTV